MCVGEEEHMPLLLFKFCLKGEEKKKSVYAQINPVHASDWNAIDYKVIHNTMIHLKEIYLTTWLKKINQRYVKKYNEEKMLE